MARQQVDAAQQQIGAALASLGGDPNIVPDRHPSVLQAKAALDRARLNLSYTVIVAPSDGIVTKVEQLQVGDYVTASTPLFSLMSADRVWVEANFKETELTHMRPGQAATVEVDTYPGVIFPAKVESLSPGTGQNLDAGLGLAPGVGSVSLGVNLGTGTSFPGSLAPGSATAGGSASRP